MTKPDLSLTVDFTLQAAEKSKQTIIAFLNEQQVDEDIISCVELAVYEAVVNIIEHGQPDKTIPLTVDIAIDPDNIIITITHSGNEFDITKVKLPDIVAHYKSGKKRGLGIYFIRTLMDTVIYSCEDNFNTLVLEKRLSL